MAVYSVHAIALQDLVRTGPDPFASGMSTTGAAIGTSTLRLPSGAGWTELRLNDTDTGPQAFEDTDQTLAQGVGFNGAAWPAGVDVENEYSYVLRPEGATDSSQDVTIYALQFDAGAVQGIAASGPIARDVTYRIISGDSSPATSYSALAICFAPGTAIATPGGWRAVESLGPGDLVDTLDAGPQRLVWVGAQEVRGQGARAIHVAPGVLGNHEALVLSPQHRVLAGGHLVPVKALVSGGPVSRALVGEASIGGGLIGGAQSGQGPGWGPGQAPGQDCGGVREVRALALRYHHLLFDRHQLILAAGAWVESLYPGPLALAALTPVQRAEVLRLCPDLALGAVWTPARPFLRPGQWTRAQGFAAPRRRA